MARRISAVVALFGALLVTSPAFAETPADTGIDTGIIDSTIATDGSADTATGTDTATASDTATGTDTATASDTATGTDTATASDTATGTDTATASDTASGTDTRPDDLPTDGGPADATAEGSGCAIEQGTGVNVGDVGALSLGAVVVAGLLLRLRRRAR